MTLLILLGSTALLRAQESQLNPTVHGNFQIDAQSYQTDKALGITESNVKVRVFRAREKLAALLKEAGHVS